MPCKYTLFLQTETCLGWEGTNPRDPTPGGPYKYMTCSENRRWVSCSLTVCLWGSGLGFYALHLFHPLRREASSVNSTKAVSGQPGLSTAGRKAAHSPAGIKSRCHIGKLEVMG